MLDIYDQFYREKDYEVGCPAIILNTEIPNTKLLKIKRAFKADYVEIEKSLNDVCLSSAKILASEKLRKANERAGVSPVQKKRKREAAKAAVCVTLLASVLSLLFIVPAVGTF
jgi:hypothetical protein